MAQKSISQGPPTCTGRSEDLLTGKYEYTSATDLNITRVPETPTPTGDFKVMAVRDWIEGEKPVTNSHFVKSYRNDPATWDFLLVNDLGKGTWDKIPPLYIGATGVYNNLFLAQNGTWRAVGSGASGSQGLTGVTGASGSQGLTGATGASGGQGLTGATGVTGASGAQAIIAEGSTTFGAVQNFWYTPVTINVTSSAGQLVLTVSANDGQGGPTPFGGMVPILRSRNGNDATVDIFFFNIASQTAADIGTLYWTLLL